MPYPTQTSAATILATATSMLEQDGVEHLTLVRLASALGVRAPSLYRYFASRSALLLAINVQTLEHLFAAFDQARATALTPHDQIVAVMRAHRQFAHAQPRSYALAFTAADPAQRPDPAWLEAHAIRLQQIMAHVVGEPQSLVALRGALALAHGWVLLELNQQLQRGGDLNAAYDAAIAAYLAGWRWKAQV